MNQKEIKQPLAQDIVEYELSNSPITLDDDYETVSLSIEFMSAYEKMSTHLDDAFAKHGFIVKYLPGSIAFRIAQRKI